MLQSGGDINTQPPHNPAPTHPSRKERMRAEGSGIADVGPRRARPGVASRSDGPIEASDQQYGSSRPIQGQRMMPIHPLHSEKQQVPGALAVRQPKRLLPFAICGYRDRAIGPKLLGDRPAL
jgi:hypothetical protein